MPATEERQYLNNLSRDLSVGRGLMMSKCEHVQIQIVVEAGTASGRLVVLTLVFVIFVVDHLVVEKPVLQ